MKIQVWIAVYVLVFAEKGACQCSEKLINGTMGVDDDSITASSFYDTRLCLPEFARIGTHLNKAWCPATNKKSEYLQVEFKHVSIVKGFMLQGRTNPDQYIKSFKIKTSHDGIGWGYVTDNLGEIKVYQGSDNATSLVTRAVNETILTKFIRFHPETWFYYPAVHLEILGCPKPVVSGRTCWTGKSGVPDEELSVIHQTTASNNVHCGKVCYKYQSCRSFMFDFDTTECHLYSIETFNITEHVSTLSQQLYYVRNFDCIP